MKTIRNIFVLTLLILNCSFLITYAQVQQDRTIIRGNNTSILVKIPGDYSADSLFFQVRTSSSYTSTIHIAKENTVAGGSDDEILASYVYPYTNVRVYFSTANTSGLAIAKYYYDLRKSVHPDSTVLAYGYFSIVAAAGDVSNVISGAGGGLSESSVKGWINDSLENRIGELSSSKLSMWVITDGTPALFLATRFDSNPSIAISGDTVTISDPSGELNLSGEFDSNDKDFTILSHTVYELKALFSNGLSGNTTSVWFENRLSGFISDESTLTQLESLTNYLRKDIFADSLANYDLLYGLDSTVFRTFSDLKYLENADSTNIRIFSDLKYLENADSTAQRTFSDLKYATKAITDSLAEDIAGIDGADTTSLSNRIDLKASLVITDSLAEDIAAIADSNFVTATELADSAFALSSEIPDTTYLSGRIDALPTVAEMETAIGDSVDLRIPKDLSGLTYEASLTDADIIPFMDEDGSAVKRTTFGDLPASVATTSLLNKKVNLNEDNVVSGDTIPSYYSFYQSYKDTLAYLLASLSPIIIPSPNPPTNLVVTPGNGATADIVLTWTAPTGEFDSVSVEANIANAGWKVLGKVDSGATQTYTHASQTAGVTIYYRLRSANTATPIYSNYTDPVAGTVTNINYNVWYVSNADIGAGTGVSWATAMELETFLTTGNPEPNDTVYIDGGVSSMEYSGGTSNNSYVFTSRMSGSSSGKIVFTRGIDANHNGTPTFTNVANTAWGSIQLNNVNYIEISYIKVLPTGSSTAWAGIACSNDGNPVTNVDILYSYISINYGRGFNLKEYDNFRVMHDTITTLGVITATIGNDALWGQDGSNLEFAYNIVYNGNNSATDPINHRDVLQLNSQNTSGGTTSVHHNFVFANGTTTGVEMNDYNAGTFLFYNNIWSLASLYDTDSYGGGFNINMAASTSAVACSVLIFNETMLGGQVALGVDNVDYIQVKNSIFRPIVGVKKVAEFYNMPSAANQVFDYNLYEGSISGLGGVSFATWQVAGHDTNSYYNTTLNSVFELLDYRSTTLSDYTLDDTSTYGIDDGTDLSAIGTYQFDDDINGTARGTWDRGALVK